MWGEFCNWDLSQAENRPEGAWLPLPPAPLRKPGVLRLHGTLTPTSPIAVTVTASPPALENPDARGLILSRMGTRPYLLVGKLRHKKWTVCGPVAGDRTQESWLPTPPPPAITTGPHSPPGAGEGTQESWGGCHDTSPNSETGIALWSGCWLQIK